MTSFCHVHILYGIKQQNDAQKPKNTNNKCFVIVKPLPSRPLHRIFIFNIMKFNRNDIRSIANLQNFISFSFNSLSILSYTKVQIL